MPSVFKRSLRKRDYFMKILRWILFQIFDITTGAGYSPLRTFLFAVLTIIVGTLFFGKANIDSVFYPIQARQYVDIFRYRNALDKVVECQDGSVEQGDDAAEIKDKKEKNSTTLASNKSFFEYLEISWNWASPWVVGISNDERDTTKNYNSECRKLPLNYPNLIPLYYSIDAFVPFLDLHQETYWEFKGESSLWYRIYFWFHIIFGWGLSTLFATSIVSIIRRD
jgi:hypothetical protein